MRPFLATRWKHCEGGFAEDASILDGPVARWDKALIVLGREGGDPRETPGIGVSRAHVLKRTSPMSVKVGCRSLLPLPEGEGWGEGLQRPTERRHAVSPRNPSPSHRFAAGPSLSLKEREAKSAKGREQRLKPLQKPDLPGECRDPDRARQSLSDERRVTSHHPQPPQMNLGPGIRRGGRSLKYPTRVASRPAHSPAQQNKNAARGPRGVSRRWGLSARLSPSSWLRQPPAGSACRASRRPSGRAS
jgi:hypothetical protein